MCTKENWFDIHFIVDILGTEFPKYPTLVRKTAQLRTLFNSNTIELTVHTSWYCGLSVVYFDQHLGAAHSKRWSKKSFSAFFVLKSLKKQEICSKILQNTHFFKFAP